MRKPARSRRERTVTVGDRTLGYLGTWASTFTLAWLASHRGRLHTLLFGGRRLSILVIWDVAGRRPVDRSPADDKAIYQLVYGEPWPDGIEHPEETPAA